MAPSSSPAKRFTLNRATTKWFVAIIVLSIMGMALWTAYTIRDLSSDPETQEVLEKWKKQVE